jgi:hypothetical protein
MEGRPRTGSGGSGSGISGSGSDGGSDVDLSGDEFALGDVEHFLHALDEGVRALDGPASSSAGSAGGSAARSDRRTPQCVLFVSPLSVCLSAHIYCPVSLCALCVCCTIVLLLQLPLWAVGLQKKKKKKKKKKKSVSRLRARL